MPLVSKSPIKLPPKMHRTDKEVNAATLDLSRTIILLSNRIDARDTQPRTELAPETTVSELVETSGTVSGADHVARAFYAPAKPLPPVSWAACESSHLLDGRATSKHLYAVWANG